MGEAIHEHIRPIPREVFSMNIARTDNMQRPTPVQQRGRQHERNVTQARNQRVREQDTQQQDRVRRAGRRETTRTENRRTRNVEARRQVRENRTRQVQTRRTEQRQNPNPGRRINVTA